MRCIDWTPEYLEGRIIVSLLQANEVDAYLFDENFVRQNWFEILGYGGFRVMVPNQQSQEARQITADYRAGTLASPDEASCRVKCMVCLSIDTEPNPNPRRAVFLFCMFFSGLIALFPFLLRWLVQNRYRCRACGHRWRERRSARFGTQQRDAQAALAAEST
ncbi:MAG TPA: hypothetical protein PKC03_06840 [Dokdonella sp.]|nr:hypothetical protein [Dokdonella sp.]